MKQDRSRFGRFRLVAATGASALALLLSACGGDDISQDDVDQAAEDAVQEAQEEERIDELEDKLKKAKRDRDGNDDSGSSNSGSSVSGDDCGNGISAGANTSCPFALYVGEGYRAEGPGVVRAYSPTTGETYAMTCEAGDPAVCRGGNNATVYIHD